MSTQRYWARVLVPVYRAALWVGEVLRGEPKRLAWPVVSVGSLSAGGAGKTPVVIALAVILRERGWGVDVLSRGYGRSGAGVELVSTEMVGEEGSSASLRNDNRKNNDDNKSEGNSVTAAARFGDEPVLIAERAGVDVWVGADRFAAGLKAEAATPRSRWLNAEVAKEKQIPSGNDRKKGNNRVHLLDDGFQHRRLARAMDVVLVTAEDLDDAMLPAGNLREPLRALARADVVVVRDDEFDAVGKRVWALVGEGAQMWTVRRRLRFPAPMFVFGAGLKPVAFCAIARPEGFAAMLLEAGCGIVETVAFGDHHRYAMGDIERVIEVAKGLNATGFVTTEKDAVKLSTAMRARLEVVGPMMVVALEAEFADAEKVVAAIESFASEKRIPYGNDNQKSSGNDKEKSEADLQ